LASPFTHPIPQSLPDKERKSSASSANHRVCIGFIVFFLNLRRGVSTVKGEVAHVGGVSQPGATSSKVRASSSSHVTPRMSCRVSAAQPRVYHAPRASDESCCGWFSAIMRATRSEVTETTVHAFLLVEPKPSPEPLPIESLRDESRGMVLRRREARGGGGATPREGVRGSDAQRSPLDRSREHHIVARASPATADLSRSKSRSKSQPVIE